MRNGARRQHPNPGRWGAGGRAPPPGVAVLRWVGVFVFVFACWCWCAARRGRTFARARPPTRPQKRRSVGPNTRAPPAAPPTDRRTKKGGQNAPPLRILSPPKPNANARARGGRRQPKSQQKASERAFGCRLAPPLAPARPPRSLGLARAARNPRRTPTPRACVRPSLPPRVRARAQTTAGAALMKRRGEGGKGGGGRGARRCRAAGRRGGWHSARRRRGAWWGGGAGVWEARSAPCEGGG